MPPEGQSPVQQQDGDDEYNATDRDDGNIRQSKHGTVLDCSMLAYNTIGFDPAVLADGIA